MWDISACGAIASGEDPLQAAERETFEETGIKTRLEFVENFMNVFPGEGAQTFRRLSYLYIGETDQQPVINEEVEEFRAVDYKELSIEIKQRPADFVPSFLMELEKAVSARSK